MTPKKGKTIDFEQALGELEAVVEKLEHGDLPLEEALKQFEVMLARETELLKEAEQDTSHSIVLRLNSVRFQSIGMVSSSL